jgi:glycosyltransferase involved in cell wall biosynthesis
MGENMRKIVVSAVNFNEAGALATLKECLEYLSSELSHRYEIIALVNNTSLFDNANIKFLAFPLSKKSWLFRLYYEYVYFHKFSKELKPYLWFSLHDMTPRVQAQIRAVYVLNPSPFYKLSCKDIYLDFKFALFNLFYGSLYAINIKKNHFVVVQQDCLKRQFKQLTGARNIIVAHPGVVLKQSKMVSEVKNTFFYPAFPRVFKNFEVIGNAVAELVKMGVRDFQVIFTISGKENAYARYIYNSYKHLDQIKFIGAQSRDRIYEFYQQASCVIFPSKLETWGLPISEAKLFSKPILLADLPYAHETLGGYDKAKFFSPDDSGSLAQEMKGVLDQTIVFQRTEPKVISAPFAKDWKGLFDILLSETKAIDSINPAKDQGSV